MHATLEHGRRYGKQTLNFRNGLGIHCHYITPLYSTRHWRLGRESSGLSLTPGRSKIKITNTCYLLLCHFLTTQMPLQRLFKWSIVIDSSHQELLAAMIGQALEYLAVSQTSIATTLEAYICCCCCVGMVMSRLTPGMMDAVANGCMIISHQGYNLCPSGMVICLHPNFSSFHPFPPSVIASDPGLLFVPQ